MNHAPEPTTDGLSRRRIVRGAAWATPAVLVASAVPASAASGATGVMSLASSTFTASGVNSRLALTVTNTGGAGAASLTGVSVDITLPAAKVGAATVISGSGWVLGAPVAAGSSVVYTATYAGAPVTTTVPSTTLTVDWAPQGDDPYPVTATLSGRATSNATSVTATATLTRAGESNPLMGITLTQSSSGQHQYATLNLPAGLTLTNPTVVVTWTPSSTADTNSKVTITGWKRAFTQPAAIRTTTLTLAGTASGTIPLDFLKPLAVSGAANDFTLKLTATTGGSATAFSRSFTADYV